MKTNVKILAIVFFICCAMLFLLDDCIDKNMMPFQDDLIKALFFSCNVLGAIAMFCGMIGLYDSEIPPATRKIWRFLAAVMFLTFTVSSLIDIIRFFKML